MKLFYCLVLYLSYFVLVIGVYDKATTAASVTTTPADSCFIDDNHYEEFWNGYEVKFFTYVKKKDVVNIKITYHNLEATEFSTTLFFYPRSSTHKSGRNETKNGTISATFSFKPIQIENSWVEFRVKSSHGVIEVNFDPKSHEQIHINQSSKAVRDLTIRASNISICEKDKNWSWNVSPVHPVYIPLGIREFPANIDLIFDNNNSPSNPIINIRNWNNLPSEKCSTYHLAIETNSSTLQCRKDPQIFIEEIKEKIEILVIMSDNGPIVTSVKFHASPLISSPANRNTGHITNHPSCKEETIAVGVMATITLILVVLLVLSYSWGPPLWKKINDNVKTRKNRNGDSRSQGEEEVPMTTPVAASL